MHRYYNSQMKKMRAIEPIPVVLESVPMPNTHYKKFNWEEVFGYIVTAGYLIQSLFPDQWFSLGRCLFSFRLGF